MLCPDRGSSFPKWAAYTKRVLVEEATSLPHLIHIWALIVRHADMFTSSRHAYIPQMIGSLQRLGASVFVLMAVSLLLPDLVVLPSECTAV